MKPSRDAWYSDGLRFTCTQCGLCCGGEPGYVWVTRDEIAAMSDHLTLAPGAFRKRYVRRVFTRLSLREHPNGDCVILRDRQCVVYQVRPRQCNAFPFWGDALRSRASWDALMRRCPGVGKGRLWNLDEIRAVLAGRSQVTEKPDG